MHNYPVVWHPLAHGCQVLPPCLRERLGEEPIISTCECLLLRRRKYLALRISMLAVMDREPKSGELCGGD